MMIAAVVGLSNGMIINCDYDDVAWAVIGTRYSCQSTIIDAGNRTTVHEIAGEHMGGRSYSDVEVFRIWNFQVVNQIPLGLGGFFPNIILVDWFRGNLTTISAFHLEQFPNLIMLNLEHNNLVSLDGDLFRHVGLLEWIAISDNMLQNAGVGLLDDLHDLNTAHFESNPCISFFAGTPERIVELRSQLLIRCPPLATTSTETTTELEECSIGCQSQIDSLENNVSQETRELRSEIEQLRIDNASHEERIDRQDAVIADYEGRIAQLESLINEILSNPCLQC